jgi:adenylate kinase
MPLNVVMLGAPGAGKGTQAERLAERERVPQISTGEILREAASRRTALGLAARAVIDGGHFVDDRTMIGLAAERLGRADCAGGFVLDGFPRTVAQGVAADALLDGRGELAIVHLQVPEAELVRRLTARLVCLDCGRNMDPERRETGACRRCGGEFGRRADDGEDVIRERMLVYARETAPLVAHYGSRATFVEVDGHQPAARVAEEIRLALAGLPAAAAGEARRA